MASTISAGVHRSARRSPGDWLPRAKATVEATGEDMQPTLPHEDRFLSITLPLWDWDYLQHPAVDRPSELWTYIWSEWPDNMEGD